MMPVVSQEYLRAVEEATNAFMKVMALRGFNVRDYPQNFVAQMVKTTRLDFEASRNGAHANADRWVSEMLSAQTSPAQNTVVLPVKGKNRPFDARHQRVA